MNRRQKHLRKAVTKSQFRPHALQNASQVSSFSGASRKSVTVHGFRHSAEWSRFARLSGQARCRKWRHKSPIFACGSALNRSITEISDCGLTGSSTRGWAPPEEWIVAEYDSGDSDARSMTFASGEGCGGIGFPSGGGMTSDGSELSVGSKCHSHDSLCGGGGDGGSGNGGIGRTVRAVFIPLRFIGRTWNSRS
jgi:hypothetical protein